MEGRGPPASYDYAALVPGCARSTNAGQAPTTSALVTGLLDAGGLRPLFLSATFNVAHVRHFACVAQRFHFALKLDNSRFQSLHEKRKFTRDAEVLAEFLRRHFCGSAVAFGCGVRCNAVEVFRCRHG